MDLPSTRELELEALVRQRDGQVSELNDEITRLRQYVTNQPTPSATDPVTLPPPLMNILLPYIKNASQASAPGSSTVLNALTQRVKLLQEENDEMYEILKVKETGKLKEEVRGLRKVVQRLEGSLRESHQVIDALSTELDKVYDTLMTSSKQIPTAPNPQRSSRSPRSSYHTPGPSQASSSGNNGASRLLPTGPRAFKKPRLSDPRQSPPEQTHHPLPPNPRSNPQLPLPPHRPQPQQQHSYTNNSRSGEPREHKPGGGGGFHKSNNRPAKMDVDEDGPSTRNNTRGRERERDQREHDPSPSPALDREREPTRNNARDRDRGDNDKERNRDRDRGTKDRDRTGGGGGREKEQGSTAPNSGSGGRGPPRRNGVYQGNPGRGGHGGGHGRRGNNNDRGSNAPSNGQSQAAIDRSLAERMGL